MSSKQLLATAFAMASVGLLLPKEYFRFGANNRLLRVEDKIGNETVVYNLPESAEWCQAPKEPPLPYDSCKKHQLLPEAKLRMGSGMCSIMYGLLDVTSWAFSNELCFFVNEDDILLRDRSDPNSTFINRYFEPIGVAKDHQIVRYAREQPDKSHIQDFFSHKHVLDFGWAPAKHIESLGIKYTQKHDFRKLMTRRMFRFQQETRHKACSTLESHNLADEYMAFSIRRGDKHKEVNKEGVHPDIPSMERYVQAAELMAQVHYGGEVPPIFVATDDCQVMSELREMRPKWRFESECDKVVATGYDLANMANWTQAQLDEHFEKFFVELIGMASAKVWVGISYTNVAFIVYYMRQQQDDTFVLLDGTIKTRIP